jgi:hypothetical protein
MTRNSNNWQSIDKGRYMDISSDSATALSVLAVERDEVIAFCEQLLQNHQPMDDYR